MLRYLFGGSGGAGGAGGGAGGAAGAAGGDPEEVPVEVEAGEAAGEADDEDGRRKRQRAQAVLPAVVVCDHPTCIRTLQRKQRLDHCALCGLCLAEGLPAAKCTDKHLYCAPGCVPAETLPSLCTKLFEQRKRQREVNRGLREELHVSRTARQASEEARLEAEAAWAAALAGRKESQRALAKAEKALAEATGLCDGCQMTVPECVICLAAPAVVAHVPCGHRVYCLGCNPGQPHLRGALLSASSVAR